VEKRKKLGDSSYPTEVQPYWSRGGHASPKTIDQMKRFQNWQGVKPTLSDVNCGLRPNKERKEMGFIITCMLK